MYNYRNCSVPSQLRCNYKTIHSIKQHVSTRIQSVTDAARAKACLILLPLHDGEETPNCGSLC